MRRRVLTERQHKIFRSARHVHHHYDADIIRRAVAMDHPHQIPENRKVKVR